MLHHEEPQHIMFSGESYSGKTTQMRHALDHLCFLGDTNCSERVRKSLRVVLALVNAGTPVNPDSTRCALQTQLTFGTSGKFNNFDLNLTFQFFFCWILILFVYSFKFYFIL